MISKLKKHLSNFKTLALAFVFTYIALPALSFAQTSYDFASSTSEAEALRNGLIAQAWTIAFGAIAVFIGFALALMGANYVWGKFKKFTGMKKKL